MVKLVLATMLIATWLVQCGGDPDLNDTDQNGCPIAHTVPASAGVKPPTVRVGVTGALNESASYLAEAEGYFAQQGLSVQLVNFIASTRMVPALASGQIEVASGVVGPSLFTVQQGSLCVKLVAGSARQEPNANGLFLFARKDLIDSGQLRTYADLKGAHVAVPARDGASDYAVAKLLEAGGLARTDATIVQMGYPGTLVGLANKSVDVALLPESQASAAVDRGLGVKWKALSDVLPDLQSGVVLYSPKFAAEKDLGARWMAAYLQGARDYDDAFFRGLRRGQIVDQLVKTTPLKDSKTYDEIEYPYIDPNGGLNVGSVQDQMNWFLQAGQLREPGNLGQIMDMSFVDEALARVGTYP